MRNCYRLLLSAFFALITQISFGQSAIAELKFEEAEIAFNKNDYKLALRKLDEFDNLLKEIKSKSLYLRIVCQDKVFHGERLYISETQYDLLASLRENCQIYLEGMESLGLDDKFREVYQINESLKVYPSSRASWLERMREAELIEQRKALELQRRAEEDRQRDLIIQKNMQEAAKLRAEEQKKKQEESKYYRIGLGYYGGVGSPIGGSWLGTGKNYGFGVDVRGSVGYWRYLWNGEESDGLFTPQGDTVPMNYAAVAHFSFPITYPLYWYVGGGFGVRGTAIEERNSTDDGYEYTFLAGETGFRELEVGLIYTPENFAILRVGLSTFRFRNPVLTFGILLNIGD